MILVSNQLAFTQFLHKNYGQVYYAFSHKPDHIAIQQTLSLPITKNMNKFYLYRFMDYNKTFSQNHFFTY